MYEENKKRYLKKHGFEAFCPQAVLFDMDGVLFDSLSNHAVSWHESMKEYGLDMAPEEAYAFEGQRGVETIKILARRQWHRELTDDEAKKMYVTKTARFSRCPKAPKMPGAETLMRQVKASGLKIVIVTGSGQKSLLGNLQKEYPGLISSELMVTAFDCTHGKPNPEPYLRGLQKADVAPYEAIVVENAPLGVRAAVAADIFTVAVNTGPLPDSRLWDEGCDVLFPSMQAFSDAWKGLMNDL